MDALSSRASPVFIALYFKLNPQRCPSIMVARDLYRGWWLGPRAGGGAPSKQTAPTRGDSLVKLCHVCLSRVTNVASVVTCGANNHEDFKHFNVTFFLISNELVEFNYQMREHLLHRPAWSLLWSIKSHRIHLKKIEMLVPSVHLIDFILSSSI